MLDIPDLVIKLFDSDRVRKNVRIHFPQSGRPDITNENIVEESLTFTESVCSQETFAFGLAESSVIEFETVGVDNMLGEIIEAAIEIDATTLPAELQTVREDLPHPIYPVPLGRFVVTECPRNHEAMAHRKVRAMSQIDLQDIVSANDRAILSTAFISTTNGNLEFYKDFDEIQIDLSGKTEERFVDEEEYTPPGIKVNMGNLERLHYRKGAYFQEIPLYCGRYGAQIALDESMRKRIQIRDAQQADYAAVINQIVDQISHVYADATIEYTEESGTSRAATRDDIENAVAEMIPEARMFKYWSVRFKDAADWIPNHFTEIYLPDPTAWVKIPQITKGASANAQIQDEAVWTWWYSAYENAEEQQRIKTYVETGENPRVIFQRYYRPAYERTPLQKLHFKLKTNSAGPVPDVAGTHYIMFPDLEIMKTMALAFLELNGTFGCFKRDGGTKIKTLEEEPVLRLKSSQYEAAWWDEYDLAPVGSISYNIGTNEMVFKFGEGESVYRLSCDKVFETLNLDSAEKINEVLNAALVEELKKLMYTPAEIEARGLPYIEAGDCIELEAHDGTILKTYVLERSLQGIQRIQDQITADGITIAEVNK